MQKFSKSTIMLIMTVMLVLPVALSFLKGWQNIKVSSWKKNREDIPQRKVISKNA